MKKIFLTLFMAGISTALFSQSYGEENHTATYIVGGVFGFILWAVTLYVLVSNATKSSRIVKIQLLQLELQLREHNARTGEGLTLAEFVKELPRLNKEIKKAELETVGDE